MPITRMEVAQRIRHSLQQTGLYEYAVHNGAVRAVAGNVVKVDQIIGGEGLTYSMTMVLDGMAVRQLRLRDGNGIITARHASSALARAAVVTLNGNTVGRVLNALIFYEDRSSLACYEASGFFLYATSDALQPKPGMRKILRTLEESAADANGRLAQDIARRIDGKDYRPGNVTSFQDLVDTFRRQ